MTTPALTAESEALYVREHRCYNADRNVTLADWDRGVAAIEAAAVARHVRETGCEGYRVVLERALANLGGWSHPIECLPSKCVCGYAKARAALAPTVAASEEEWTDEGDPGPFAEGITPSPATEAERQGGEDRG